MDPARIFAYLSLVVGIGSLVAAFFDYRRGEEIRDVWPQVDAEVTSCAVVVQSKRIANTGKWHAECGFRYTIGGRTYISETSVASAPATDAGRSGFPEKDKNRQWVADQARQYEPGARRQIHYQPGNPGRIAVGSGTSWIVLSFISLVGLVFTGLGILILVLRERTTPKSG